MRVEDDLKLHNKETIEKILEFYQTEKKCCAIQATGTGKTFLILRLLEIYNDMDKAAVIFAPNREIIKQTKKRMKTFGLNNATFYTYQKLAKMTEEEILNIQADLIVCDELHRTGANTWGNKFEVLVNTHPESKVFGVTATPLRCTDGRDMAEEYFDGNKACNISLAEALVREIIPVMPVYVSALYTFEEEYQNMSDKIDKSRNSQEEKVELQEVLLAAKKQLEKANGVPEIIKKYITNYNGKYIIFCKDKKHLYAMKDVVIGWFRQAGYEGKIFEYPYYSNSSAVKKNLENFENNKEEGLKLLYVIDKLNEGLHLGEVHGCILLRTTVSNIIYYQQIGRVIDAGSDEKRVILDLVSNFNSLKSFNLKKDLEEKIRERQEGKFSECSVEFDLKKFDVVDCVQECVDVFISIDSGIIGDNWPEEDEDLMRQYYPSMGIKVKSMLSVERSKDAIFQKARKMGLVYNKRKKWLNADKIFLKENYGTLSVKEIAEKLNRTEESTENMAYELKLRDLYRFWSDEETRIFKQYYPIEGKRVANRLPYKTEKQCLTKARKLKLKYIGNKTSKSKYVSWSKQQNKWQVVFVINGKRRFFGYFKDEEEAGKVAMEKAKEYGKI